MVLAGATQALAAAHPKIRVLSNRADLVSGGAALVQVAPPAGAKPSALTIRLNGRRVTGRFAVGYGGRFMGVVKGMRIGRNTITATARGRTAALRVRNHPIGGPVLAGPQIQPSKCFKGARDAQCNRPVEYEFLYKSTRGGGFRAYDTKNPPSDVATTTTDQGRTVPFIVRQETGVIDRDQYRIAILYDPRRKFSAVRPQPGFNHKLVIFHGFSCETEYRQAEAPDVLNETALGRGFATMSHALDHAGHNCNLLTQAESLIMTKERVIDRYGPLRYTIGSGCSGGALAQQQVANAYPGVYDGITPQCSFPDAWSSAMQYANYELLRLYYENPTRWRPGVVWTPDSIAAVEGHPTPLNAITFTSVIPGSGEPTRNCPGVPREQVYHERTNPDGVRCTLHDYTVNAFGRRPQDGFAGRPIGNVGFQYGLKAVRSGRISPAQFVDVNEKIGGRDIDYGHIPQRIDADRPALSYAYRSGVVNTAENLDRVPIIDSRGPDPGAFHDVYRTYVLRARLDREHGTHANQVLWRGQLPIFGDETFPDASMLAMDRWLAAIERDKRKIPLARKIIEDKPKSLTDRCTDGNGNDIPHAECDAVVQSYSDPQIEGGMPLTDDTLRCALKPLRRSDYGSVEFTDAQWATLRRVFPQGVCDFTKAGPGRVRTNTWQTYQTPSGKVIYGGRPLGPRPRSRPLCRPYVRIGPLGVGRAGIRVRGRAGRLKGCARVRRVQVSFARRVGRGRCRHLGRRGRFGRARSCKRPRWLRARGTRRWRLTRRLALRPGSYLARARAIDSRGRRSFVVLAFLDWEEIP